MALSAERKAQVLELFDPLGDLTTRPMMGGLCIYHRGTIFAIMMQDGSLWLKSTGPLAEDLAEAGCTRWRYQREGLKPTTMPYWSMPDGAEDDPELACDWARKALAEL